MSSLIELPYGRVERKVIGDLFSDPDSSATVLHGILMAVYKDELYGDEDTPPMDPIEIWMRVSDDFRVQTHENNENKVNAMMLALSTDAFYESSEAFTGICMALYDGDLGDLVDGVLEDLTVPEVLWGIYEVELNRDDHQPFSPRIVDIIDSTIGQEAEDREEDPDETLPYFERIVALKRNKMFDDMRSVGWPETIIRKVSMGDLTPRHDDEAEFMNAPPSEE